MKILALKSSGNKNSSSNMLADEFIRGAREAGHKITEYDVFRADIKWTNLLARCNREKNDGAIAAIMGLDRAIQCGNESHESVYDSRGILFI